MWTLTLFTTNYSRREYNIDLIIITKSKRLSKCQILRENVRKVRK